MATATRKPAPQATKPQRKAEKRIRCRLCNYRFPVRWGQLEALCPCCHAVNDVDWTRETREVNEKRPAPLPVPTAAQVTKAPPVPSVPVTVPPAPPAPPVVTVFTVSPPWVSAPIPSNGSAAKPGETAAAFLARRRHLQPCNICQELSDAPLCERCFAAHANDGPVIFPPDAFQS